MPCHAPYDRAVEVPGDSASLQMACNAYAALRSSRWAPQHNVHSLVHAILQLATATRELIPLSLNM